MARRKKIQVNNDSPFVMDSLIDSFALFDPITFTEKTLTVDGQPFLLTGCGRDYLHEIYQYICLEAVGPKGLPIVVKKGRQVEMTTTASAISLYFACSGAYDHIKGLHTFPQIEQARRYSKLTFSPRVQESIGGCLKKLLESDGSVTQKPFKRGNFVLIEGAGEAGDRLRGISPDYALFDEVQDLTRAAHENTQEALSHSKMGRSGFGVELYFGTPKDVGSDFYTIWKRSDQRLYYLKCLHCGHFFPIFYDYSTAREMTDTNFIEGFMVECRDKDGKGCRQKMDKRRAVKGGKWIAQNTEGATRGYHIDQLLIPGITRESIDEKLQTKTARSFANEVMGEFYAGRETGPSFGEVVEATTMDPNTADWRYSINVQDRMTWMGIDWGQRISGEDDEGMGGYTVVTILSKLPQGKFKLEFAHRMEQSSVIGPEGQIQDIMNWIRLYNCKVVACDFGAGHVQNQMLKDKYPDRVLEIVSSANCRATYRLDKDAMQITIDKHRAFEEFYDLLLEQKALCFPYKEPIRVEWLMQHLANVEIVSSTAGSGLIKKMYKKSGPNRPVDGACALVYAYVGYMYQKTQGFSSMDMPNFTGNRNMPMPGLSSMKPMARGQTRNRR